MRESNTTSHLTPTIYFFFFFALMLNENVNCFRILRLYLLPYWGVFNYCHEHPPVHAHSSAFGCAAQQLDRYNRWTCTSYCCMPNGIASRFRPGRHFSHCIRHLSLFFFFGGCLLSPLFCDSPYLYMSFFFSFALMYILQKHTHTYTYAYTHTHSAFRRGGRVSHLNYRVLDSTANTKQRGDYAANGR